MLGLISAVCYLGPRAHDQPTRQLVVVHNIGPISERRRLNRSRPARRNLDLIDWLFVDDPLLFSPAP